MVKGLDLALLNKVRSEIDKKADAEDDSGKTRYVLINLGFFFLLILACLIDSSANFFSSFDSSAKEDQRVTFRTMAAKVCIRVSCQNSADDEMTTLDVAFSCL